jgi:hypothetical protein
MTIKPTDTQISAPELVGLIYDPGYRQVTHEANINAVMLLVVIGYPAISSKPRLRT